MLLGKMSWKPTPKVYKQVKILNPLFPPPQTTTGFHVSPSHLPRTITTTTISLNVLTCPSSYPTPFTNPTPPTSNFCPLCHHKEGSLTLSPTLIVPTTITPRLCNTLAQQVLVFLLKTITLTRSLIVITFKQTFNISHLVLCKSSYLFSVPQLHNPNCVG